MKKFLGMLLVVIVPFGWLLYILANKKFRKDLYEKLVGLAYSF